MDRIRKLYSSFSKTEIRYLKNYLVAFHNKGPNRSLELLQVLEKRPDITNQEMAEKLYGDPKSKAFSMLKSRLYDKMLETLTLSINFQNNPRIKEDQESFQVLQIQKMILHANFLKRRGQTELAIELLEKAAKLSQESGSQDIRLSALIALQNTSKSLEDFRKRLMPEINEAKEQYLTDIFAVQQFDEFRILRSSRSSLIEEELKFLQSSLEELELRLENHPSLRATYYYHSLKFDHSYHLEDYEQCRAILKKVDQLLKENPGLGSSYRLAVPYIKLAVVETNTHNYQKGYEAGSEAVKLLHPQRHNYLVGMIYKTFSGIYLGKLDECLEDIEKLSWFEENHKGIEYGIAIYLKSCIYFLQGKNRDAYNTLIEASQLMSDKSGWNVGLRIFEILLLVELNLLDLIPNKLENLRKHLAKYAEVEKRMLGIYRILMTLDRKNYNYGETLKEMEREILEMNEQHPWIPVNHEVIRVDQWLAKKVE